MEAGLVGHLNEDEFLGPYGLHSLAKGDPCLRSGRCRQWRARSVHLFSAANRRAALQGRAGPDRPKTSCGGVCGGASACRTGATRSHADRIDYRHDTPLQCTLDGVAAAQCIIFGMFGVDPQLDGSIRIHPQPAACAGRTALRALGCTTW